MVSGSIELTPLEFLAVAALPLSALSSTLKQWLKNRFGNSRNKANS